MSADTEGDGPEWTPGQLLNMDEEEARNTLPVAQFERWEKLHDLDEQATETKAEWEGQAETVAELTVHADEEQLGTEVDIFGNTLLVRVPTDDREFRQAATALDEEFGDDERDIEEVDPDEVDRMADLLVRMLDRTVRRWNGHDWRDLDQDRRDALLADAREKWGIDGLLEAWADIQVAVVQDKEEKAEVIDSFLGS